MVFIIKLIDRYVGRLICNFLGFFNKAEPIKNQKADYKGGYKGILVVQLWGIGETILTLPAIAALRKKFPKANIDVLATPRNNDVYFNNSNVSGVFTVKLNPFSIIYFIIKNIKNYDIAIDMEECLNISAIISFFVGKRSIGYSHDARSRLYTEKVKYNDKQHAVQTFLDLARVLGINDGTNALPKLNFSKRDKRFIKNFLKKSGIKDKDTVVCVAPGAAESAKSRMWPSDRYAELCDEIISRHNAKIVFVGTSSETGLIEEIQQKIENEDNAINAAGKTTLSQLFCLISRCNLFIGNDAGPMHIAAAQGVKTIGLFGPNIPLRFGPYGKGNIGVYNGHNCEFSPCINVHKGQVPDCLFPKSSNDYQKCMKNISVDDVLKAVDSVSIKKINLA